MKQNVKDNGCRWRQEHVKVSMVIACKAGFTLIEVIVMFVLLAVAGTMLVNSLGFNLSQSAITVPMVSQQYQLIRNMERLTGYYRNEIQNESFTIDGFYDTYVNTATCTSCVGNVDTANTGFINLTSTGGSPFSTTARILQVTLRDGDQTVQSLFTE